MDKDTREYNYSMEELEQKDSIKKEKRIPRLSQLLFKNTIALLVPAVLIFGIIFMITIHYPILYRNSCRTADSLEELQEWYNQHCYNVKYELTDLKYTGYDYYEDERRIGAYYYTIEDDQFLFVLVKTRNPESVIADKTIRGRLLSDSAHLEAMLDGFIDDTGLDKEALLPIIYPLMLSEVDYPIAETVLIWLLIILPYIVTTAVIILSVVWTIQPYKHPSAGKLSEFGERQLVYQEISSQLRREGVKCNYHYYFTADYLILSHWFTTDFIRVDYIRYISKHVIRTMGGRRQIYRLTMSNPKKMIFEKNFRKEACVDEIMEELIRRNPQIDNRTRHVFDLPEAEENQIEEPMLQHTGDEVEDVKIYKVKHRLRGTQEDAENMKIYKVKRRLRKKKDTSEDSD